MAEFSLDKITRIPNTQKLMILLAVIAALIGSYLYLIHFPSRETLRQKNEELGKLQAKYDEQQKVLSNLPKFREELRNLEAQLAESLKLLPNTREIPSLLTNISMLAQECGLEIMLFQPQAEVSKGFYADIPVEMEVSGKYHNLGYFFEKISKLNRIVNVSEISISGQKLKKAKTDVGSIDAEFNATTFKFIEKAAESDTQKKDRPRRKR